MATPPTWLDLEAAVFALATDIRRTEYLELLAEVCANQNTPVSQETEAAAARFEWLCRFLSRPLTEALRSRRAAARSIDKRGRAYPVPSALWTWEWKVRGTIDGFGVWRSSEKIEERWQIAFSLPQAETLPDGEWLTVTKAALACAHHGAAQYVKQYRDGPTSAARDKAALSREIFEGSAENIAALLWQALRDGDLTARSIDHHNRSTLIPAERWRKHLTVGHSAFGFLILRSGVEYDLDVEIALQPASLIEDASAFDDAAGSPPPAAIESEAANPSPAPSASIAPPDPRPKAGGPRDNEKRGRGAPKGPREGEAVKEIAARAQELYSTRDILNRDKAAEAAIKEAGLEVTDKLVRKVNHWRRQMFNQSEPSK